MTTGPPARILVVDDTPANVKLLVDVLTAKGFAVTAGVRRSDALAGTPFPDLPTVSADITDAAELHFSLAILWRLFGVGGVELAGRSARASPLDRRGGWVAR